MKITVRQITIGAILIALLLFVAATIWLGRYLSPPSDPIQELEYFRFTLEVYKAIGLGFLITLLGVAIPNILPEARYEFETSKEARMAYSKVKTGVIYLQYKLADLNFSDAIAHLENLHFQKHLAENYPQSSKNMEWLKNDAYNMIDSTFKRLGKRTDWDSIPRNERLKVLLSKDDSGLHK
jgi:hypothetical protein